jgi:hypothetical protein
MSGVTDASQDADSAAVISDSAELLHRNGQDALLELELATLDMDAREKWMLEQLLLTYVADSVPAATWAEGLAAGARAVRRDRARRTAESLAPVTEDPA